MANEWTPASWRQRPAAHIPVYPDKAASQAVEQYLATYVSGDPAARLTQAAYRA